MGLCFKTTHLLSFFILFVIAFYSRRFVRKTNPPNRQGGSIVITGGNGVLGRSLITQAIRFGLLVISLDVEYSPNFFQEVPYVIPIVCDITEEESVNSFLKKLETIHAKPFALINTGAIAPKNKLLDMSSKQLARCIHVNTIGQFNVTKMFYSSLLLSVEPHIINVTSALAYFSASGVAAYSCSKAALLSLHETLEVETKQMHAPVKLSLYSLGQFKSTMFDKDTPNKILAPLLNSNDVAHIILRNLMNNQSGRFYYPLYVRFMPLLRFMPSEIQRIARWFSGMDEIYS
ncbi:short chain dehydrogenase DHRS3 family, implicated in lipid (isoprenoid) metabolism [Schizosaccharomyces osmophilus]|uniref:Short chain dehydrogenase DHRS3 family, implicated in lipid (Isoprenoid) metabolism n=1 Tax=Schizosaccharomyces osmophilus TaxID=2545709 RepID=A0AAE9W9K4_9SCHI|nr:short chain dehydrogenase DHRS3 family, implicated in lipid (isoprenoid) metabolism [Schizosaccharomyces osmophilus]WBW71845.1 short chain dehydrogenase DHRS3 family, implicated in lipid (isoprenoid) metabolism [Schizosaccharomyces osmophilus]